MSGSGGCGGWDCQLLQLPQRLCNAVGIRLRPCALIFNSPTSHFVVFAHILAANMQADAGKEEPMLSAVLLMNRTSDRWLLQQPITSHSKPFPARRVTPTRLLSSSAAADRLSPMRRQEDSDDAGMALQVRGAAQPRVTPV